MNPIPLQLSWSSHPQREPDAWLLTGDDPRAWLDDITSWPGSQDKVRLRVIPASRQERHALGVLVTCEQAQEVTASATCLPYGRVAGRLFLPIEAGFSADVSERELSELLDADKEYVFHPTVGLIGFAAGQILTLADFLAPPSQRERSWDAAHPGLAPPRKLTALLPEEVPTVAQVIEQGRGDIGKDVGKWDDLPPASDESTGLKGMAGKAGRYLLAGLAGLVSGLASLAPRSLRPGFLDKAREWAGKKLTQIHEAWNREKQREIRRLMELLKNDPDRGLKYALPIGGTGAPRGLAPGSNKLTRRSTDFSLSQLGGGEAVDWWDLPEEYRRDLVARYRELANRALHLGRHRRAAYIFAQLLGDLEAAATALTGGHHWREAAILYRDQLKRPHEAARCLEQGGLWTEAIELYVELKEHEKAGDLYRKIEQEEPARGQYARAASAAQAQRDYLQAARIFEFKLDSPEAALQMFDEGWLDSRQPAECLRGAFDLRGRHGQHVEARARIEQFDREPPDAGKQTPLVEVLAEQTSTYPDRQVREHAREAARQWTARRLPETGREEASRLLGAFNKLVPEDRLLGRDCQRYLDQRFATKPRVKAIPAKARLEVVREIQLPCSVNWTSAIRSRKETYVGGYFADHTVTLARVESNLNWSHRQMTEWPSYPSKFPLLMAASEMEDRLVFVHAPGFPRLPLIELFPLTDGNLIPIGGLAGVSIFPLGVCRPTPLATFVLEYRNDYLTLISLGSNGETLNTIVVPGNHVGIPIGTPMHGWASAIGLALETEFLLIRGDGTIQHSLSCGRRILGLWGTPPHSLKRAILGFADGCAFVNLDRSRQLFADDLHLPKAAFLGGDAVAVAGENGVEVYRIENGALRLVAEERKPRGTPIAVLPADRAEQFLIIHQDGLVQKMRF